MRIFVFTILILLAHAASANRVVLSTVSFDVPATAAAGNKVIVTTDGIATYAWNRLKLDSACYYYSYSFKLNNALYEFRECHKADIYESFETIFKPGYIKAKELSNFEIERFRDTPNEFLNKAFTHAVVEYNKGMRKLTLIYTINKTTLFTASIKSSYSAETFLQAQADLDSMLLTAYYTEPLISEHPEINQKGELSSKTAHDVIKLPFLVGTDFNNPIVEPTPDGGFVMAFAHSEGTEIFFVNSTFELTSHVSHDKIIHDIAISDKGFYSLSSTDYNMLIYGIYPSLYLNKHKADGTVELSQVVFKKNNVKLPKNQVFDYYSRDNVCLEIADTFGIIYMNSEKRWPDFKVLQSGVYKTFSLENGILKKDNEDLFHVSHCFAQASTHDDQFAYLVSLGDAWPRGVCLSKVDLTIAADSVDTTSFYHHLLYKVDGTPGDNYVGDTHFSEPLLYNGFLYVIIETEQGARTDIATGDYLSNKGHNDLFLVKCSLDSKEMVVKQLTKTDKIEEVNPKLAPLGDNLLLIYSEAKFDKQSGRYSFQDKYLLLDERGGRESTLEIFNSIYHEEPRSDYKMPDSPINRDGSNLITLSDGKLIWVRLLKNAREVEVISFAP
ncbi:MAG: hypothetical protein IPM74_03475 [Crocinitomicaceae bacterium]|nr:hypothetical protein [Crocinitomicaceae bacterium]MBK8924974.1 hypothetical protein [Crocinitomicaceae bacterium]